MGISQIRVRVVWGKAKVWYGMDTLRIFLFGGQRANVVAFLVTCQGIKENLHDLMSVGPPIARGRVIVIS